MGAYQRRTESRVSELASGATMTFARVARSLLLAALVAVVASQQAGYEEDYGGYEDPILDEEVEVEHGLPAQINEFARRVQSAVDSKGLLRARRWGNIANGVLLGASGPVTLAVSALGLKLSGVVLSPRGDSACRGEGA